MDVSAAVTVQRVRITTVVLCSILVVLSLMIITALALSSSPASGQCLLYADQGDFGPKSVCTYIYVVVSLFQLIACLARAILLVVVLAGVLKDKEDMLLNNKHALTAYTIVDVIACLLTLVSGGLISHGFSVMCAKVYYPHSDKCSTLAFYSMSTSSFIKNHYSRLNIAQAGIWISWVVWILLVVADVLLLWKAGVLADLKGRLGGAPSGGDAAGNKNHSAVRRDRDANHSQRSFVALLFRGSPKGEGSDTESGSRTPPPRRPVPPRPPVPGGAGVDTGREGE